MLILGINETSHDASISVIEDGNILFAAHSERYSKVKNDWYLNNKVLEDALKHGKPDVIGYYEKPFLKASRIYLRGGNGQWLPKNLIKGIEVKKFKHHYSHAAAGYYTSKFTDATIVVLDAIGEWNTSTIWKGSGSYITNLYEKNYPFSFGLFYSAFTKLVGLKPNEEEYIFMGMAGFGKADKYYKEVKRYFPSIHNQSYNFHTGIYDWPYEITDNNKFDIAAAVQQVYSERLLEFMVFAKRLAKSDNLVFMGGCALNCSANTQLWNIFKDVWIMPNPGDAGSSLGAAAAVYGKHVNWENPYLGHDLGGKYPVDKIISKLKKEKICAVATGKAEYGPRALGNRSILADPRDPDIKYEVNKIKKREMFRPFAPVVLEEDANIWFDMDFASPYMQYAVKCKKPDLIPSVVHKDGTSRVQTVNREQHAGLYEVLSRWKALTGIPVLLNTSLNIKGQPLLNDLEDVSLWEETYKTKIVR